MFVTKAVFEIRIEIMFLNVSVETRVRVLSKISGKQ